LKKKKKQHSFNVLPSGDLKHQGARRFFSQQLDKRLYVREQKAITSSREKTMKYKDCGCRDDDYQSCPRCEGWSQAELDKMNSGFAVEARAEIALISVWERMNQRQAKQRGCF
jgi:hypothetical protein